MRKIMAHAATGIFLFIDAIARDITEKNRFGLVVREPNSAKMRAKIEELTEAMIDIRIVSFSLSRILGSLVSAFASGKRLVTIQTITLGIAVAASAAVKFVIAEAP
jgi:hypothetical protein